MLRGWPSSFEGFAKCCVAEYIPKRFLTQSHAYVAEIPRRNSNLGVLALDEFNDLTDRKAVYRTYRGKRIRLLRCAHSGGEDQDEPQGLLRHRNCDDFVRL